MELFNTIDDMISIDPRKRLRAEYNQAKIRLAELDWTLTRGTDVFLSYELVEQHRDSLLDYLYVLEQCCNAVGVKTNEGCDSA